MKLIRDAIVWAASWLAWPVAMWMLERGHNHRLFYKLLGFGSLAAMADDWKSYRLCLQWNLDGRPDKHPYIEYLESDYDNRRTAA